MDASMGPHRLMIDVDEDDERPRQDETNAFDLTASVMIRSGQPCTSCDDFCDRMCIRYPLQGGRQAVRED